MPINCPNGVTGICDGCRYILSDKCNAFSYPVPFKELLTTEERLSQLENNPSFERETTVRLNDKTYAELVHLRHEIHKPKERRESVEPF